MDEHLDAAIDEARKGLACGGIPNGSVLVIDGKIVTRGHTSGCRRVVPCCTQKWTALRMPGD